MAPAALGQERSLEARVAFYALARRGLVARAIGREAIIAVGDAHGDGNRLGALALGLTQLLGKLALALQVGGRHDALDLGGRERDRTNDLVGEQHLAGCALWFRRQDRE